MRVGNELPLNLDDLNPVPSTSTAKPPRRLSAQRSNYALVEDYSDVGMEEEEEKPVIGEFFALILPFTCISLTVRRSHRGRGRGARGRGAHGRARGYHDTARNSSAHYTTRHSRYDNRLSAMWVRDRRSLRKIEHRLFCLIAPLMDARLKEVIEERSECLVLFSYKNLYF